MTKPRHSRFDCNPGCSVEAAISLIDGKWKCVVLYHLLEGTMRFNEMRRRVPCVTQRMLTNQLRELEADGLIVRRIYPQVPPKVEYSLSPLGRTLEPIVFALKMWGETNMGLFDKRDTASPVLSSTTLSETRSAVEEPDNSTTS